MLSKNKRPYDADELPAERRLRRNIVDLFGRNQLSGSRTSDLLRDAALAGAPGCSELVSAASSSDLPHGARTLCRRLLKWSLWPDVYIAEISVMDFRAGEIAKAPVAFLLPHELVAALCRSCSLDALMAKDRLDRNTADHLRVCEEAVGGQLLGLGLWGDGVPCNWDRSDSLQMFALNLPGLPPPWHTLRIPLTGFSKKHFAGKRTYDDLMAVFAWSFQQLAAGKWPVTRHDGSPWTSADVKRKKQAGSSLPLRAALVEIRGDWAYMKETFGLPAWNELGGLCWLCSCTPAELRQASAQAPWRQNRLDLHEVLARMLRRGSTISPIFAVPWLSNKVFRPDWLHCADQGVSSDYLGNLFFYLIDAKMSGANRKERCMRLWSLVQQYYSQKDIGDRLQNLVPSMLSKPGQPPKLRSSAAQCRALVPCAAELARAYCQDDVPVEQSMKSAAEELSQCYAALSSSVADRADALAVHSRRFAAQYIALETAMQQRGDHVSWRVKPKMHMFLELCSDGSQPSLFWTYRDEDFGGACAHLARRRGGLMRPGSTSDSLLRRFRILQPPPRIV